MIPLFRHNIGEEDIERCVAVLRSNWHTTGPVGEEVEQLISNYYGGRHVSLTNSCTAGLLAVALAIKLKPGDEVLVPAMTFTATAASVLHYGAKPVFVDIDRQGLINIDDMESKITDKTRAIYVVNLYGHMPDIERISQIAQKHGLFLLEDCAHAFDSTRDGHRPSTFSDVAVYSFYATKTIHCGEGGAVITRHKDLHDKIRLIRRHGLTKQPSPGTPGNMGYNVTEIGFKGVLSDIHASLLHGQVKRADEYREMREEIALKYAAAFEDLDRITPIIPDPEVKSSWYTFPTYTSSPKSLAEALAKEGIGHTVMYQTLEDFDVYKTGVTCTQAKLHGEHQLSLPCYPALKSYEQDRIIETIRKWN